MTYQKCLSIGVNVTLAKNGFIHFVSELKPLLKISFVNSVFKKKRSIKDKWYILFNSIHFNPRQASKKGVGGSKFLATYGR